MPEAIKPLVYVSYAWRNRPPAGQNTQPSKADDIESFVNELCQVLSREDQFDVGRDKRRVRTGDAIVDFAGEIASGGLILAVISHKSLRSDWCMVHELLQAFRRRNFDPEEFGTDVLALVLEDALNDIRDPRDLVRHWLARLEQEQEQMELADPGRTGSPESWKTVDRLAELRGRLPDLIRALRIRAMPRGAEAIREQGFQAIRKLVRQRLEEKGLAGQISTSQLRSSGEALNIERANLDKDDEPTASEHILLWRVKCRIWREPLAQEVDLPMVWVPSDTAAQVGEFLLGVEPVSLRQWREVVGGSLLETTLTLATPARGDLDQPVTGISQEQALEFCRLLALHSGRYYELPSEEQWDHACRAGSVSAYSWGEAWSGRLARAIANPWGLRRMHGSVWQWCRGGALRGGAANEPVGLRVCCLPFGTPYFHLEASKSQWRPRITRAACARVLARPLSEAEFTQLEQALQRFHILGLLRLRLFLSLLADRLAGGADDPQHPLSLEMAPDGLRRLATPAAMDPFTTAAFAWQERDWRRLTDSARPPQELLAELGLASGERQQAVLHAIDRAASAFPEPR